MIFSHAASVIALIVSLITLALFSTAIGLVHSVSVALITAVIGVPLTILIAYDVACTIEGSCDIWSWVKTILLIFKASLIVAASIMIISLREMLKRQLIGSGSGPAAKNIPKKPSQQAQPPKTA